VSEISFFENETDTIEKRMAAASVSDWITYIKTAAEANLGPRAVLRLPTAANLEAVRNRFKYIARLIHPDKNEGSIECKEVFQLAQRAKEAAELEITKEATTSPITRTNKFDKAATLATMAQYRQNVATETCIRKFWAGPGPARRRVARKNGILRSSPPRRTSIPSQPVFGRSKRPPPKRRRTDHDHRRVEIKGGVGTVL
jgi:hypothetical protein